MRTLLTVVVAIVAVMLLVGVLQWLLGVAVTLVKWVIIGAVVLFVGGLIARALRRA